MSKKLIDYLVTSLTVASAALLIVMLFVDLATFDVGYNGYFILDANAVEYHYHAGKLASTESLGWVSIGLVVSALILMIPIVLRVKGKNAVLFSWISLLIIGSIIAAQFWGVDHAIDRIRLNTNKIAETELHQAFYFPYYAMGFAFAAALLYTFFGEKKKVVSEEGEKE